MTHMCSTNVTKLLVEPFQHVISNISGDEEKKGYSSFGRKCGFLLSNCMRRVSRSQGIILHKCFRNKATYALQSFVRHSRRRAVSWKERRILSATNTN